MLPSEASGYDITPRIRRVKLTRAEFDRCTTHGERVLVDEEGGVWHVPDDDVWWPSQYGSLSICVDPLTRDEKLVYLVSPCR